MSGKQLKLFLVDGTPGGLTTAEITNWTGHVLTASRSDAAELMRREEASRRRRDPRPLLQRLDLLAHR